ncbi:uncharacterized protein LOC127663501 isoform X2 [Xyrauchen texanus]|uniref:uncharacterized protein LOC127663501 isoform X1 n=1 Tax=Xyrauchen texanus TaxID=154827 RepID=UPI002242C47D|nr:uncharacterized protein LOC127663501 isoform X1 [Xyrauchen texanus]XP_052011064.1 uncharacterized protein LOC127663501 isoform X2 [Xyrauchen texanus]
MWMCSDMPEPSDVMIASPVYQQQPCEVSQFLKIKPLVFGVLEILTASVALGFTSWQTFWFLSCLPVFFMLTGVVTVSAACIRKPRLVKIAQILNYINIVTAATSLRINFRLHWGMRFVVLVVCDVLVILFSIIIASSSCSCCCRPKSRSTTVSYMNTNLPVNNIVFVGQPDPSAFSQPGSSVLYVMPANYGPVPTEPPGNFSQHPTSPPPAYEDCVLYAPETRTEMN